MFAGMKENDGADYVVILEQSDHPVSKTYKLSWHHLVSIFLLFSPMCISFADHGDGI